MKELQVDATLENLEVVQNFVSGVLEENDCPMKAQIQIEVAVEELYVNIAHYAYGEGCGSAVIQVEISGEPKTAHITFIDSGTPYDPLAKADPDVSLSAEKREIGGLGIFIVKKSMDDMQYEYKDGQNRLTIIKKIG